MIDEQSSASGHDYASVRSAIGAGGTQGGGRGPILSGPPRNLLSSPRSYTERYVMTGVYALKLL